MCTTAQSGPRGVGDFIFARWLECILNVVIIIMIIILIITYNNLTIYIAPISLIVLGALQCYIFGDLNGLFNAVYKHE